MPYYHLPFTGEQIEKAIGMVLKGDAVVIANCPNCGAPIKDSECPYCGTTYIKYGK